MEIIKVSVWSTIFKIQLIGAHLMFSKKQRLKEVNYFLRENAPFHLCLIRSRSSHKRCSIIRGVLRNFENFTVKHLCQSLFFNKVAGLSHATLVKKTLARTFSCKFWEIFRNTSGGRFSVYSEKNQIQSITLNKEFNLMRFLKISRIQLNICNFVSKK